MRALELVLHYRCNCRCRVCVASQQDQEIRMEPDEALGLLKAGRDQGATELFVGGGEPTLYRQLGWLCRAARRLGYQEVVLHSNGQLLAEEDAVRALADAGATGACLSLKGGTAEQHDGLTQVPGAYERLVRAARELGRSGLTVEIDPLITSASAPLLADIVRTFADLGACRLNYWLLYLEPSQRRDLAELVPRLETLGEPLAAACRAAEEAGVAIRSYHVPPCFLLSHRAVAAPERSLGILLAEPGRPPFALGETVFGLGAFAPACEGCHLRVGCTGIRDDYIEVHGMPRLSGI